MIHHKIDLRIIPELHGAANVAFSMETLVMVLGLIGTITVALWSLYCSRPKYSVVKKSTF